MEGDRFEVIARAARRRATGSTSATSRSPLRMV
jgi:hypothetical protein